MHVDAESNYNTI